MKTKNQEYKAFMKKFKKSLSKDQDERIQQMQDFILPIRAKIIEVEGFCDVEKLIGETCAELGLSEEDYQLLCYWSLMELE